MGLSFTKLFNQLFTKKDMFIMMVGLDVTGKTTIRYKLKRKEIVTTILTIGFNVETVECKNISFTVWDVGGQDKGTTIPEKNPQCPPEGKPHSTQQQEKQQSTNIDQIGEWHRSFRFTHPYESRDSGDLTKQVN